MLFSTLQLLFAFSFTLNRNGLFDIAVRKEIVQNTWKSKRIEKDKQIYEKYQQIRKLQEEIEAIHERHVSAIHTTMENHTLKKAHKK
jgi:tRNA G10  N-methylase Trm11